jgi:hypothetical protein
MWPVYCTDCGQFAFADCRQITRVVNLAPGVIAVEVRCVRGHRIPVLTGAAVRERTWTRSS